MTRKRKIELIQKYRPYLFSCLLRYVPDLVFSPENASIDEIQHYNRLVESEAKRDNNNFAFQNRFSF